MTSGQEDASESACNQRTSRAAVLLLALLGALLAALKFPACFTGGVFPSWDLFGHVALAERLRDSILHGRIAFFDPYWFGGWPAFTFYAPLAHLLAALLSFPLALFCDEPVQRSVAFLTGLSLALLPLSLFLSARLIAGSPRGGRQEKLTVWLAGYSALFGMWFLGHPLETFGVGVSAGLDSGLFPQVLSWHLVLGFGAAAVTAARHDSPGSGLRLALVVAVLALTHSLTFLCCLFFGACFHLWCGARRSIGLSYLVGIGLAGGWLIPGAVYGGSYSPLDRLQSAGGIWALIFPEPLGTILAAPGSALLSGAIALPLVLAGTIITAFTSTRVRGAPFVAPYFAFTLLACLFVGSDYFGLSFPLSIHLYRTLVVFLLLLLAGATGAAALASVGGRGGLASVPLVVLALWGTWTQFPARPAAIERTTLFAEEGRVLQALKDNRGGETGRVFFEHLGRPGGREIRSPHYLPSRLAHDARRETANGLFIQSSLSQAYPAFAAKRLHIHSYNVRQPMGLLSQSNPDLLLERLRDLGVSQLVLDARDRSEGRPGGGSEVGRYRIVDVAGGSPLPVADYPKKVLIGYRDELGTLPFREMEALFFGSDELFARFALLEVPRELREVPKELATILVHAGPHTSVSPEIRARARIFESPKSPITPLAWGREDDDAKARERYLLGEQGVLTTLTAPAVPEGQTAAPRVTFDFESQELRLESLVPGRLVRIRYSYFPFWKAEGGSVFRGEAEQLWLRPNGTSAVIRYRPRSSAVVWGGYLVSALSLGGLLRRRRRAPSRFQTPDCISSDGTGTSEN